MHTAARSVRDTNHAADSQRLRTFPLQEADRVVFISGIVEAEDLVYRCGAEFLVKPREPPALVPTRSGTSSVLEDSSHSKLMTPFRSMISATSDTEGIARA